MHRDSAGGWQSRVRYANELWQILHVEWMPNDQRGYTSGSPFRTPPSHPPIPFVAHKQNDTYAHKNSIILNSGIFGGPRYLLFLPGRTGYEVDPIVATQILARWRKQWGHTLCGFDSYIIYRVCYVLLLSLSLFPCCCIFWMRMVGGSWLLTYVCPPVWMTEIVFSQFNLHILWWLSTHNENNNQLLALPLFHPFYKNIIRQVTDRVWNYTFATLMMIVMTNWQRRYYYFAHRVACCCSWICC